MKQTQRHNGIIELVKQQGYVSTEELVEHFSVSPQTIRRDLNDLAEQKMILRHHGGDVVPIDPDAVGQQAAVAHVLVGGLHAPGMAGGGVLNCRRVEAGEDLHHPGDFLRRAGVDGLHEAVGDGAVENLCQIGRAHV